MLFPVATHRFMLLLPQTPFRFCASPLACAFHAPPPLVVLTMVPLPDSAAVLPTAHTVLASAAHTPFRLLAVPLTCAAHDMPPLVVATMLPAVPTAHWCIASVPVMAS